jgi:hypothetical protein
VRRFLVAAIVLGSAAAHADDYPTQLTDRPLVLPGGLTTLSAGTSSRTYRASDVGLFDFTRGSLGAAHGFGGWALFGGASFLVHQPDGSGADGLQWLHAGADAALGEHDALTFHAFWIRPSNAFDFYQLDASYERKVPIVPHRFSIYAAATLFLDHQRQTDPAIPVFHRGFELAGAGRVLLEVQLAPRLAVSGGASATVPIAHADGLVPVGKLIDVDAEVLYAFDQVDLSAGPAIYDVTGSHDLGADASVIARF